jgi:hypothetical protein
MSNWLFEFRLYRRDESGRIIKKDDHLMDATRYLVMGIEKAKTKPADKTPVTREFTVGSYGGGWIEGEAGQSLLWHAFIDRHQCVSPVVCQLSPNTKATTASHAARSSVNCSSVRCHKTLTLVYVCLEKHGSKESLPK